MIKTLSTRKNDNLTKTVRFTRLLSYFQALLEFHQYRILVCFKLFLSRMHFKWFLLYIVGLFTYCRHHPFYIEVTPLLFPSLLFEL